MAQIVSEETHWDAEIPPEDTARLIKAEEKPPQNARIFSGTLQTPQEIFAEAIVVAPTSLPYDIQPGSPEAIQYRLPSYTKAMAEYKRLMELQCQALNFQNQGFGRVPLKLLVQLENAVASHQKETHLMLEEVLLNIRQDIAARKEEYKKRKEA